MGRVGRLLRRGARRRDQRAADAAAAGLGAQAVHLRAGVRSRATRRRACSPTCRRTFRRPRPACSTARATTTAGTAVRCWRGARWRSENVPAVALASELGVPNAAALPDARRLHDVRRDAVVLRPRPHARQRRGAPRRARRGVRAFARGGEWIAPTCVASDGRSAAARARTLVSPRTAFWITDILTDPERARVHLRPRRQPRVSVPGGGEDRHVAGVSRQLDRRLHARRHRRRVGRQLRSHAAARLDRRHRRRRRSSTP